MQNYSSISLALYGAIEADLHTDKAEIPSKSNKSVLSKTKAPSLAERGAIEADFPTNKAEIPCKSIPFKKYQNDGPLPPSLCVGQ